MDDLFFKEAWVFPVNGKLYQVLNCEMMQHGIAYELSGMAGRKHFVPWHNIKKITFDAGRKDGDGWT